MAEEQATRALSGVRPVAYLHLGHYFGAIREMVEDQEEEETFFLIADYHALVLKAGSAEGLRQETLATAAACIACGVDPDKAVLYRQSDVPEVCELTWLLSTVTPLSPLRHGPVYRYRERTGQPIKAGMLSYPVLMAADILLVGATVAVAGRDQFKHLEIAREVARSFNRAYGDGGEVVPIPGHRESSNPFVVGTDGYKMSLAYDNTLGLFEEESSLRDKIRRIKTDAKEKNEPKDPDRCNVFSLYALMASAEEKHALTERYETGTIGYAEAKDLLFEKVRDHFAKIRGKYRELQEDATYVEKILQAGAQRAREEAGRTMATVRRACGVSSSTNM